MSAEDSNDKNSTDKNSTGTTAEELLAARYAGYLVNTGGNDIASLLNGSTDARINLPVAMLEACVQSQAHLLHRLFDAGLLRDLAPTADADTTAAETVRIIERILGSYPPGADQAATDLLAIGADPVATDTAMHNYLERLRRQFGRMLDRLAEHERDERQRDSPSGEQPARDPAGIADEAMESRHTDTADRSSALTPSRRGWWKLEATIDADQSDLEHIASAIMDGFQEGEIVQYQPDEE